MATVRFSMSVEGVVQGVGFRPFVHKLAVSLGLVGCVANDSQGAHIELEGRPDSIDAFLSTLGTAPPPLCHIERIDLRPMPPRGEKSFEIVQSHAGGDLQALVPPDAATCQDCLDELWSPGDRRYLYPFVNCTNCGPRFTIVKDVPYDRVNTTMASFEMCSQCRREYDDPEDRRFHAEPICCPRCGPVLELFDTEGWLLGMPKLALQLAVGQLRRGAVVAIKGLGGYHLAVLASSEDAVARLRSRKHREDKPFAVMVSDTRAARRLCSISADEEALLVGPARPVVLLDRRPTGRYGRGLRVAPSVAPGNGQLGIMLPYTPIHHLLAQQLGEPFVLTSGNVSDEPIAYTDADAVSRLAGIADAFLLHDRPVHMRADDSVARHLAGAPQLLRRSRGYVPSPVKLPITALRPILACGAELKNTFCLAKGNRAFISHHIGDLGNYEALRSFTDGVTHFGRLFGIQPEVVAYDLHPEYLSTKYALSQEGVQLVGAQHHHAHIASCLADNEYMGPVIGLAFDGLGYGDDGTLWGGEVMMATFTDYQRLGHLEPVPMPGSTTAIKQPWRMAVSYLDAAFEGNPPEELAVRQAHSADWEAVTTLSRSGLGSPLTSSMGRLFDAVAAIVCQRYVVNYEGQAAIELEQLARPGETSAYPLAVHQGTDGSFRLAGAALVRHVVDDLTAGTHRAVVAARFHNSVVNWATDACLQARQLKDGLSVAAFSGGVFQNAWLTTKAAHQLRDAGFTVLLHRQVPANDGGISLGQAAIAAALIAS